MSDIFNVTDLSPYHGDEDFDLRSDLSQARGDDAEHPTVIPMDLPSSHQAPRGPMTRARARSLKTEVTSLLSDISYDPLETWLLPKSGMLCMIRYQEDPPEDACEGVQAPKFMDEENPWKELRTPPRTRKSGHDPGRPAPGVSSTTSCTASEQLQAPDIRPQPGHPAMP